MSADITHLHITDFGHGGVGIARHNDKVVFVRGALPGEIVSAAVTKDLAKRTEAVVVDVHEASEHRVDTAWADGAPGRTGAADLAHATLDYQRSLASHVLAGAIRRVGGEDLADHLESRGIIPVVRAVDSAGWHTRTRFDVVATGQGWGMHAEGSPAVLPIDRMPLAVADLESFAFGHDWSQTFRRGERVRFVAPSLGECLAVGERGVFSAPGVQAGQTVTETVSTGTEMFDYDVAAGGFWQVHYLAPRTLLCAVMDGAKVQPGERVLELFSGAGLFTLPLARAVGEHGSVAAFEGDRRAVGYARTNLERFAQASVGVARIDERMDVGNVDVIVADPPRKGLGIGLAQRIAHSVASRIVLVSCDPAAAARDVAALVRCGREVASMHAFDIFPQTHHFEVVTTLA